MASRLQISFLGDGKIIENTEIEKESSSSIQNVMASGINEPIIRELQKLTLYYTKNSEINNEILSLIEKTIQSVNMNDKIEAKKLYSSFITMGLINDCNELGLNTLINEIKANIYWPVSVMKVLLILYHQNKTACPLIIDAPFW